MWCGLDCPGIQVTKMWSVCTREEMVRLSARVGIRASMCSVRARFHIIGSPGCSALAEAEEAVVNGPPDSNPNWCVCCGQEPWAV
ncbi:hypothetical protein BV898_18780 [Hypsibius exemplaris]|uniref:Uncharacterized protein n=1 Tax=Hypsibius exemplaris TaxID=2072580 RepID=A0A9X6NK95_HYPEX|nr:hypothetical protein BV898_18780 [Hypsibius exemplaris]